MTLKCNIQGSGASSEHSEAICGELAPYVAAAGSTQATATLLRRLTRHIVTSGIGGVILNPGVGRGEVAQPGDEIEIANATGVTIIVYPPLGVTFYGSSVNAGYALPDGFSLSILVDSATRYFPRYYTTAGGLSGTVTSVGLTAPTEISVAGSPITTSGTLALTWASQTQNKVFASPNGSSGTPAFRPLIAADLPNTAVTPGSYTYTSITVDQQGRITAAANGSAPVISANPTASVGPAAVNGVATTYMRSDAAPKLGDTTVTPGAYTNAGFTVDQQGRLTAAASGTAPVTSVGLSLPSIITVSGSPVTSTGTLTGTLATQTANTVWSGPTNGSPATPTFRALGAADLPSNSKLATIFYAINGGGSVIATGLKEYMQINFDCTISANTLLADQSTTSVVNIWKCTYSAFDISTHPVAGDKITASAPPTITAAVKSTDSTLTGWTVAITAGDILAFNVDSNNNATRLDLMLKVTKT